MGDQTLTAAATPPPPPPPVVDEACLSSKIPFRPRKIRKLSDPNHNHKDIIPTPPPPHLLPRPLTSPGELSSALAHLRSADPLLSRIIDSHQPPSFQSQSQTSPFHSLARSILYQQLAIKAAASIYSRFLSLCGGGGGPTPASVLALSPLQLRHAGVSTRKASYLHDLASKFSSGVLADSEILSADDDALSSLLTTVKGVGPWSVHMFLIFFLHRPDVLPVGDLGVRKGVQMLYGLDETPRPAQVEQLCEKWRPYRSVGAWYMWRLVESKGLPTMASASS